MDTADRAPDLPEPLAQLLDTDAEAAQTWAGLSPDDRHALGRWVHQAWFERGERTRAHELFDAMRQGPEAFSAWTRAQQALPGSTSGFFSIP